MIPKTDLFHQPVYADSDFMVIANYTGDSGPYPQYFVYELRTGQAIGTTNATNYMGTCRMIMNEYTKQQNQQIEKRNRN
jgi:hypothetical protein